VPNSIARLSATVALYAMICKVRGPSVSTAYFNPALTSWLANPAAAGLPNVPGLPGLKGDVALVSLNKRTAIPIDKKQVARRIGFAYSVDPKTVIRGGRDGGARSIPAAAQLALARNPF